MADLSDDLIDAALATGEAAALHKPRARAARYNAKLGRVIIDLTNGCSFSFPPHLVQGLESATPAQLAAVEILGVGFGLHWEELDTDLTVRGLLAGVFGTQSYMARRAGQAKSPAKAAAARANGTKGGRPRKVVRG